jgi:hypothetical protein
VAHENWNHELESRVAEMEKRADDLELIRLSEIHNEREDHISALEAAVAAYED